MKFTPWFSADVSPARIGVYQKDFGDGQEEYQYWDGAFWHYGENTPEETFSRFQKFPKTGQPMPRPWRGLML